MSMHRARAGERYRAWRSSLVVGCPCGVEAGWLRRNQRELGGLIHTLTWLSTMNSCIYDILLGESPNYV